MSFISYAQNYEDVALFRALRGIAHGTYIDVGAHDPIVDSVTRAFYERGWRGVNIEPVTSAYAKLVVDRPDDTNLQVALADSPGLLTFHEVVGTGMSTLDDGAAARHRASGYEVRDVIVQVTTLDRIWEAQQLERVHFLKIDVEGAEQAVLQGIDLTRRRPWIVLVEATLPNSMEPSHEEWEPLLIDRGYIFVYFDGLNRFYVAREKEEELRKPLSLPPNHFDRIIRHADATIHQRASALADEAAALREALRRVTSSLSERGDGTASGDELALMAKRLTAERDQRDALLSSERTQAANLLHQRELAHAERVGELSRMIKGLEGNEAAFGAERAAAAHALHEREIAHAQRLAELSRMIDGLRSSEAALTAERAHIAQTLHDREVAHAQRVDELSRMIEGLRSSEAALTAERAHIAQTLHDREVAHAQHVGELARAIDDLRAQVAAAMSAAQSRQTELNRASAELATLRAELTTLRSELQEERARATSEHAEMLRQRHEVTLMAHHIETMQQSLSWRVTRPLRATKAIARDATKQVLQLLLQTIRDVPGGVQLAGKATARFPRIDRRLRRFAGKHPRPARAFSANEPALALNRGVATQAPPSEALPRLTNTRLLSRGSRVVYFYVDHTVQCPVNTGMQRVTRGLARALVECGEVLRFVKWDPALKQLVHIDRGELERLGQWRGPQVSATDSSSHYPPPGQSGPAIPAHTLVEGHWLIVPEVTHINYHGAAVTLDVLMAARRCNLRSAFVYYDAIPLRRADMAAAAPLHETYMQHLLLADLIVPISRWSACDIASFFIHHESSKLALCPRIAPLLLPGESHFSPRATKPGLSSRKLIVAVGTIEHRKNQHTLLAAFERFASRFGVSDWELVLVGNVHPAIARELDEAQRRTRSITVISNIDDSALAKLYDECAFTVFPSVEEGFGLPIVESLWHGKPCICANFGAMQEIAAEGGCLKVDTRSTEMLEQAIERLASDAGERLRLAHEACARRLSSWSDYGFAFSSLLSKEADPLGKLSKIYYCVEHTVAFARNTGIQRVVRGLARSLVELGLCVVPVKWSNAAGGLEAPSDLELNHFAQWNGPDVSAWTRANIPETFEASDWLILPELTVYPGGPDLDAVKAFSRRNALRVAAVFYDAIPWSMREMYSAHWSEQHGRYMERLGRFDRVLAISESSRRDLHEFLRAQRSRSPDLERRVVACSLPGEFIEVERSLAIRGYEGGPVRILSVGSIEPRKNHLRLLRAFRAASEQSAVPLELSLAGGLYLPDELVAEFTDLVANTPGVTWHQDIDDARLSELYRNADFTIYPSLQEGFGLPILESLWNARPCICRNRSAMAEVAQGGGCLTVDTGDEEALARAIARLANDHDARLELAREAIARPFDTWRDYGRRFATILANERNIPRPQSSPTRDRSDFYRAMVNLSQRPRLSICVTTYNRSAWLALSLENLARLLPEPLADVEIVVCDNASTDATSDIARRYAARSDFRYYRNDVNVGMLGNLMATAHHARGRHVWVLGDDDLLKPGAIERVLAIVTEDPDLALVYLNYAYTREDDARNVTNLDAFLSASTPVVDAGADQRAPIRDLAARSENFFTAIYCLVFRRDHALRAYSQDTSGRPFSTMLTSIPTTYHVLHRMMNEPGYWIGDPELVVNMNVSWLKYASLWILERLPEVFDTAEVLGADPAGIDRWRAHNVPGVVHYFREIYENDTAGNAAYFCAARLVDRFKHVEAFAREVPVLRAIYEAARSRSAPAAERPTDDIFAAFE